MSTDVAFVLFGLVVLLLAAPQGFVGAWYMFSAWVWECRLNRALAHKEAVDVTKRALDELRNRAIQISQEALQASREAKMSLDHLIDSPGRIGVMKKAQEVYIKNGIYAGFVETGTTHNAGMGYESGCRCDVCTYRKHGRRSCGR